MPIPILLVEDNHTDARLLKETFKDLEIPVELAHASDGIEALDYLRERALTRNCPKIILLDLNMPRMDGREFLKILKSEPELQTIPVVVLSTSTSEHDVHYCYQHFASCYLAKPIDLETFSELASAIESFWIRNVILP